MPQKHAADRGIESHESANEEDIVWKKRPEGVTRTTTEEISVLSRIIEDAAIFVPQQQRVVQQIVNVLAPVVMYEIVEVVWLISQEGPQQLTSGQSCRAAS